MKIAFDEQQQPGVFIPLAEWPRLREHFAEVDNFVETHTGKSVLDMQPDELQRKLAPVAEKLNATALKNGTYTIRLNADEEVDASYINDYGNGRLDYINVNPRTDQPEVVRRTVKR